MKVLRAMFTYLMILVVFELALGGRANAQSLITFQYFYDELGQLVKVVDSTGNVVEYVYDEVGNMVEIKRTSVAGLAIFNVIPHQGPIGTTVTLQGQGFSAVATENIVTFNGVTAPVTSATSNTLIITVPSNATTGPITVAVGGETATTETDFVITLPPIITGINPAVILSSVTITDTFVTGFNLVGSTFTVQPASIPPAIHVGNAIIGATGVTATLVLTVANTTGGSFVLVATNANGSSDTFPTAANTLTVLNPAADPDFDGLTSVAEINTYGTDPLDGDSDDDGFGDGDEIKSGSNPLDPTSDPIPPADWLLPGEAVSPIYSIVNLANPSAPDLPPGEAVSPVISIVNLADPSAGNLPGEAVSPVISIVNTSDPSATNLPGEAVSPTYSLENRGGPQ